MQQQIKITNSQDSVTIDIEGTIGIPEEWQFENPQQRVATYERFRQSVQQIEALESPKVVVNIRSTGGDVNDALLIYDALTALDAEITTRCYGYVASAATVIAQAASEGLREISANALYLVHNSQCSVEGTASELAQRVELLNKTDERLAELYARRSGGEASQYRELMNEEGGTGRWLNAQETIEVGLADCEIEGQNMSETELAEMTSEEDESLIEQALKQVSNVVARISTRLGLKQTKEVSGEASSESAEAMAQSAKQVVKPAMPNNEGATVLQKTSQIALEEGQRNFKKSGVEEVEDPSLNEARRSANDAAYEHDARRFKSKIS